MQLIETSNSTAEARRQMEICNACRYCAGFCAVFPAMEQRRAFSDEDMDYLANLCHNCTGCYHACQYTSPHPFDINVPKALANVRAESYQKYAWPGPLAGLFKRNGLFVSIVTAVMVTLFIIGALIIQSPEALFGVHVGENAFYKVIPHNVMVAMAGSVSLFILLALVIGFLRFWKATGKSLGQFFKPSALASAIYDVLTLRYLGGGGEGCNTKDESFSQGRRIYHQIMMYGFLLTFAATAVGTIYDYGFGWPAPYDYFSLPVILGTVGGIGLLIGPAGLIWIKLNMAEAPMSRRWFGMDYAFLWLLMLVSVTGLLLLAVRETSAMGMVLAIHLGFVMALFIVMPYSKFVHMFYRFGALVRYALEKK